MLLSGNFYKMLPIIIIILLGILGIIILVFGIKFLFKKCCGPPKDKLLEINEKKN